MIIVENLKSMEKSIKENPGSSHLQFYYPEATSVNILLSSYAYIKTYFSKLKLFTFIKCIT